MTERRTIQCVSCHQDRPHHGRGLCATCYGREQREGRLAAWPLGKHRVPPAPTLGHPDDHDPLAVQRALATYRGPLRRPSPVHVTDPADRARIVQLVAQGELTRTQAARLLHCSGSAINAYLAELALIVMESAA